ncbi:hypothetical protein [Hymenobacter sp. B81]|uniref:hypothetical protein n=1 Tax=Hymenobacter sp. B81 TaxID=3344878 RepID=UPI0037DDDA95
MPLNKNWLKQQLKALSDTMATRTANPEQARQDYADALGDIIDTYVRGADVVGSVSTTGTAAAQQGSITSGRLE